MSRDVTAGNEEELSAESGTKFKVLFCLYVKRKAQEEICDRNEKSLTVYILAQHTLESQNNVYGLLTSKL